MYKDAGACLKPRHIYPSGNFGVETPSSTGAGMEETHSWELRQGRGKEKLRQPGCGGRRQPPREKLQSCLSGTTSSRAHKAPTSLWSFLTSVSLGICTWAPPRILHRKAPGTRVFRGGPAHGRKGILQTSQASSDAATAAPNWRDALMELGPGFYHTNSPEPSERFNE